MRIAVVGATGMVGRTILQVMSERGVSPDELVLFSTAKSAGQTVSYMGREVTVRLLTPAAVEEAKCNYALFSAGGDVSLEYAPLFAKGGCVVIDNSSAFRRDASVPLIVPQINGDEALKNKGIISNPNCSTIQLVMALHPLAKAFGLKRVVVSTYQSVSGAGVEAVNDLVEARKTPKKMNHQIYDNLIPHIDVFEPSGYTKEEEKVMIESIRILGAEFGICCTAVRVPLSYCHAESVNITFDRPADVQKIRAALAAMPGVVVTDGERPDSYPMPKDCKGRDEVYVGRIRPDLSAPNTFNMWIVADNIRKGAATNAVEILQFLMENN